MTEEQEDKSHHSRLGGHLKAGKQLSTAVFSMLLEGIDREALDCGKFRIKREGMFRGALRATFVKSFQFAKYCNQMEKDEASEEWFYLSSALRSTCEELIALRFVRQLGRRNRDHVIRIVVARSVQNAVLAQAQFFGETRPFQPILTGWLNAATLVADRQRLDFIGRSSGLWKTRGKLPSTEQMAKQVGMQAIYDFFYRTVSEFVHFSPRIALRSGWGETPRIMRFSADNYASYYFRLAHIYSVFLFTKFCRSFRRDLTLSKRFMAHVEKLDQALGDIIRWPEAVTYEEMNIPAPSNLALLELRETARAIVDTLHEGGEVEVDAAKDKSLTLLYEHFAHVAEKHRGRLLIKNPSRLLRQIKHRLTAAGHRRVMFKYRGRPPQYP